MAALIGALRVSLSADTAQFQSGMKRAERQAKTSATSIQKSLGSIKAGFAGLISGLSIGLIVQGIKASLDYAGSLGEVAKQLGVTARELQIFRYAVQQNGGTLENADQALGKFAISISKARSESKQSVEAFRAAGVSLADLNTKSKTEILGQIADKFKATGGAAANAAAGVSIFGKGFLKIVPTLDLGSKGFNELTAAAEGLGIILDDKLIDQADEAADTVDKLQTVLKAQIAGAVAENAGAIVQLANSLVYLVSKIADAIRGWNDFKNALDAQAFDIASKNPFLSDAKRKEGAERAARARGKISDSGVGWGVGGSSVTISLPPARRSASSAPTGAPSKFLGGGGGGKKSPKAPRDTSLRDAFQFEEEQRRAEMDILRAKQDLAHDYVERTALSIQMLNLEKESFEAELQFRIAEKELTKPQADKMRLKFQEADHLKRMAVLEEEEERRQRDYNMLDEKDFAIKADLLERQAELATTAKERRAVELKILDLAYEEERRRLDRIIQESKDWAEIEAARRDLLALSKKQSLDRQGVRQRTQGPLEDHLSGLPQTADQMNAALENVAANGLQSLEDGLVNILTGTQSVADAFKQMAASIIADLIRIQVQKMIVNLIGSISGGVGGGVGGVGGGFASGGFTGNIGKNRVAGVVHGNEFVLSAGATKRLGVPNLDALNRGAPLSAVTTNDNEMGSGVSIGNITLPPGMSPRDGRATGLAIGRGIQEKLGYTIRGRK